MHIVKNGDVHVSCPFGLSRRQVEDFISEHRGWIDKARVRMFERQAKQQEFYDRLPLATRSQKEEARQRAKLLMEPMVLHHAKEMGVKPSAVTYRPMTSRWGVCKIKDRSICLSTYLLLLPEQCAEYVVVHELCHLLEPSHNGRFYKLMDKYFPDWRDVRKEMRSIV